MVECGKVATEVASMLTTNAATATTASLKEQHSARSTCETNIHDTEETTPGTIAY